MPWNDEVSANVAKKFLSMIDRHFPKGSALGKHFNRSTVKVSYSCMPNMARNCNELIRSSFQLYLYILCRYIFNSRDEIDSNSRNNF